MLTAPQNLVAGSFRDPSGFVFRRNGILYRQVNRRYTDHYDHLMKSGLYDALVGKGLLIPHREVELELPAGKQQAYKVLEPQPIPFISYPYEWSFSQFKEAALTTLKVQKTAFEFGMALKDSSAYNVQFLNGRAVLIDTLSFEIYRKGQPWMGYRQYCQHFLAPLALMSWCDVRLSQLLKSHIDGIPLDLSSSLLSARTWLKWSLLMHIHLHAKTQTKFAGKKPSKPRREMTQLGYQGLMESLESATKSLGWRVNPKGWAEYYSDNNYSSSAFEHKKELVSTFMDQVRPQTVWDLGANVGVFSRIAAQKGISTLSIDSDPAAVELNYLECQAQQISGILPLVSDLSNPSPSLGWAGEERMSLLERGPTDLVMALALIHHLVIGNNTPLDRVAALLAQVGGSLIIEFVPKEDSQVQHMLSSREDIFDDYKQEVFEQVFGRYYSILKKENISDSKRTLYLMENRRESSCKSSS